MAERKRKRTTKRVSTVALVTTGTTLRMAAPRSARQPKPKVAAVVVQEMNPVGGFADWLREHAVVGVSLGFIIGSQMANLIKVIVSGFIDPTSHLFFGTALSDRTFTLRFHDRIANFGWGGVVYSFINLIFLLIFIYIAFNSLSLDKLDKPKTTK